MALTFIKETDFKGIIGTSVLTGLKGTGSENLIEAEKRAISHLDPLRGKFDIDTLLAQKDNSRHTVLVRMVVNITAYYLYNSVPDTEIPERIVDNFKMELTNIKDLASGKLSSTLSTLEDAATGEPVTRFRWGSNPKRSHGLYY